VKPPPVSEEEIKDAQGVDIEKILKERANPSLSFNHGRLYLNFKYFENWDPDLNTKRDGKLVLPIVNSGSRIVRHEDNNSRKVRRLASWERDVNDVTTLDERAESMQRDMMKHIYQFQNDKHKNTPKRNFRILSIDGGGIRGVVVCAILQSLIRRFPTLLQEIDVIAGTSTGGMLAALLGSGTFIHTHTHTSNISTYTYIHTQVTVQHLVLIFTNFTQEKYLIIQVPERTILGLQTTRLKIVSRFSSDILVREKCMIF
jgi:hypothetical protein